MSQATMTATTAQSFDRTSAASVSILAQSAQDRGCTCRAYVDWYTYRRWKAQGYQVQKGEHGVKLTTWIRFTSTGKDGKEKEHTRPKGTTVFCRCQVKSD